MPIYVTIRDKDDACLFHGEAHKIEVEVEGVYPPSERPISHTTVENAAMLVAAGVLRVPGKGQPISEDAYEEPSCPECSGPPVILGMLGVREHYRCRNCGCTYSRVTA